MPKGNLGNLIALPLQKEARQKNNSIFVNEDSGNLILEENEFPLKVKITKSNSLYLEKLGFSLKAINIIRRLAIFKNPEFYKFQAMRMSTYGKARVINCSEEDEKYLILPRGCEEKLFKLLKEQKSEIEIIDNRG